MLKRLILALSLALGLSPAFGAGTIPFSLSQQFDSLGRVLAGCKFYSIQAGTTSTPQSAYQDSALTIALPNPQTCDSAGRLPQMFFADGTVKVRLADRNGVTQVVADNIAVIGASSGSGGGGTVDPTTIIATGDVKYRYGTGVLSGFVRANGRTIGSATSGASERANADCQSLFEYLWGADATLTVSTGRGASANADWVANKTLGLPDTRSYTLAGLDGMGNSLRGGFAGAAFTTGSADVLGSTIGNPRKTLLLANLPPYTPTGTLSLSTSTSVTTTVTGTASVTSTDWVASNSANSSAVNTAVGSGGNGVTVAVGSGSVSKIPSTGSITASASSSASSSPTGSFSGVVQGGSSTPLDTISPFLLITIYLKL